MNTNGDWTIWRLLSSSGFVLGPLSVVYAALYGVLVWALGPSLRASAELRPGPAFEGPESLLGLASMVLGWVSVALLQWRLGIGGSILLVLAAPYWVVALGVGFLVGHMLTGGLGGIWVGMGACAAVTAFSGSLRVWSEG